MPGINQIAATAIRQSVANMIGRGTKNITTARPISTACIDRKFCAVSTSEVHRCRRSPLSRSSNRFISIR